jgi:hypothetical protein
MLWPLLLTYVGAARHGAGHRNPGVKFPKETAASYSLRDPAEVSIPHLPAPFAH